MVIAKCLVAFVALWNFGGILADGMIPSTAKQHLLNPRWPPHAKFHDAQTIAMGMLLGAISLWVLFGTGATTPRHIYLASAIAGTTFVGLLASAIFPGCAWHDPEFTKLDPMPLGMPTQKLLSLILCSLLIVACVLCRFGSQ